MRGLSNRTGLRTVTVNVGRARWLSENYDEVIGRGVQRFEPSCDWLIEED